MQSPVAEGSQSRPARPCPFISLLLTIAKSEWPNDKGAMSSISSRVRGSIANSVPAALRDRLGAGTPGALAATDHYGIVVAGDSHISTLGIPLASRKQGMWLHDLE